MHIYRYIWQIWLRNLLDVVIVWISQLSVSKRCRLLALLAGPALGAEIVNYTNALRVTGADADATNQSLLDYPIIEQNYIGKDRLAAEIYAMKEMSAPRNKAIMTLLKLQNWGITDNEILKVYEFLSSARATWTIQIGVPTRQSLGESLYLEQVPVMITSLVQQIEPVLQQANSHGSSINNT